jgi:hypothetical protein
MDDLQTPRNEYFLSSFSPMAMAAAQAGEPSMHQRLEEAEQATGQDAPAQEGREEDRERV